MKNIERILIVCDSSKSLLDFRGKLIEALTINNEVWVFTPEIKQHNVRYMLNALGVHIQENTLESSNVSVFSDIRYIIQLYKLIIKLRPTVCFSYAFKPVIYSSLVATFCNVSNIVPMLTGLGYNFSQNNSKKRLVSIITKYLLKLSLSSKNTKIVLQNKDDYKTLVNENIISNRQKVFVVNGSGVDLSHYNFSKPTLKTCNFLMISRLINAKGVREFYEAAKIVKEKYDNVSFTLIGAYDNNIDAIDKMLFNEIKAGNVIQYLGEVDDVRPYIRASAVVVLPSYYGEGVPRCLLEAMAMGRAVITTDSVGCRETVNLEKEQQTGFLIPVKNAFELADKMLHFLSTPGDIISFGQNGYKYVADKFDVYKVNKHMVSIIENNGNSREYPFTPVLLN
ncbi:glycosyltransferase family 4 protein [Pseudopedobacter sp.]|uniref:glycosyltransferase family 4 protein n=1 Tax=Pseudopedobacter sp. TaxID=1936787 RepID=UPI00333E2210